MKTKILTKMVMLAGLVLLSLTNYGQDYLPTLISKSTILYGDKVYASIEVEYPEVVSFIEYRLPNTEENSVAYNLGNNNFLASELPLGYNIPVYANNQFGQKIKIGEIETYWDDESSIEVSGKLFDALAYWSMNVEQPLSSYIMSMPGVSKFERIAFYQKYFLANMDFNTNNPGTDPPVFDDWMGPDGIKSNDLPVMYEQIGPCHCKKVMRTTALIEDMKGLIQVNQLDPLTTNHSRGYFGEGPDVYHHLQTSYVGPSHDFNFHVEGKKRGLGSRKHEESNLDTTNTIKFANNYAKMGINLICEKGATGEVPDSCNCKKEVHLHYQYNVNLSANAHTPSCFCTASKNAFADVEDYATVVLVNAGKAEVLESHGAGASANQSMTRNPEFYTLPLSLGLNTARAVKDTNGILASKYLDTVINQVGRLLTLEPWLINTSGSANRNYPYFDSKKVVMLEINKPLELIMYSATRTEAGGKRSFESDARAISNYSMSMILPLNNTTKEKKYCCSKKYANYQLFSHGGAPKDIPKLQKEEGYELAFWTPWDAPYNQTMSYFNYVIFPDRHYDKVFGPSYEGCDDVVYNKVERVTPKNVLEEAAIVNNGDFFRLVCRKTLVLIT